ncbi:sirohydrochlorin chelatase [Nonomuraea sp. NPDC052265]|uniref:sirohydrochlorin chelatase n=1 Tax=Nonomuraea sp. NPDC052265 TaxID=3364374 RepID=UPI0037C79ED5
MSLPVRERSPRPGGGRHRRPVPTSLPPDAPMLVLATPGGTGGVAEEIAAVVRLDNPQIEVRLTAVADLADSLPPGRDAVVVPLLTWDDPVVMAEIGKAIAAGGSGAVATEALGPHPLLAEALHIRLAERGLARADRVRLLNVSSPVDAVILGTVGGERAVHAVQATAVLLASRLTLPVVAASLDSAPGVDVAAQRLRAAGAERLAIAPCMIGHEAPVEIVERAATAVEAGHAEPLGAHSAVAELVARAYGSQLAT